MKALTLLALTVLGTHLCIAQRYAVISNKLDQLAEQRNIDETPIYESLAGKKFISVSENNQVTTKKVIHFDENNKIMVIEIKENGTDNKNFKVYTGDMVKNDNRISIRADKLEGKTVDVPYTINLMLQQRNGRLFLIDLGNNSKFLPTMN